MNPFKISLILLLVSGCAAKSNIGRDVMQEAGSGTSFQTKLRGNPQLQFLKANGRSGKLCNPANTKQKLPRVKLTGSNLDKEQRAAVSCAADGLSITARFSAIVDPGTYYYSFEDTGDIKTAMRAVVLFKPTQEDKESSSDQFYQGAKALNDGANEGEIAPGEGDKTDWWKVEVPKFTRYSMLYTQESEITDMIVQLFRMQSGSLQLVATLKERKDFQTGLEGNYFIKAQGKVYGRSSKYNLLVKKLDSGGGSGGAISREDIPVVDSWAISSSVSAVLLGAGSAKGLKSGDSIKLFDAKSQKLIDACEIASVSELEAECHLSRVLQADIQLKARRTL